MSVKQLSTGSWEVRLVLYPNGKEFRERFSSEDQAKLWDLDLKMARKNGTVRETLERLRGSGRQALDISSLLDLYMEGHVSMRNRDVRTKKSRFGPLKERLGKILANEIKSYDLAGYAKWRKGKPDRRFKEEGRNVSNATINREISVLIHALSWAAQMGKVTRSQVEWEKLSERARGIVKEEVLDAIFEKLESRVVPLFSFIRWTGCDKSVALGLTRDQMEFFTLKNGLEVGLAKLVRPKTQREYFLAIPPEAVSAIRKMPVNPDIPYVFYNPDTSRKWCECRKPWEEARKAAGHPGVTVKDMRKAFGARLRRQGFPLELIQGLMAHASITTTETYYAILDQQFEAERYLDTFRKLG